MASLTTGQGSTGNANISATAVGRGRGLRPPLPPGDPARNSNNTDTRNRPGVSSEVPRSVPGGLNAAGSNQGGSSNAGQNVYGGPVQDQYGGPWVNRLPSAAVGGPYQYPGNMQNQQYMVNNDQWGWGQPGANWPAFGYPSNMWQAPWWDVSAGYRSNMYQGQAPTPPQNDTRPGPSAGSKNKKRNKTRARRHSPVDSESSSTSSDSSKETYLLSEGELPQSEEDNTTKLKKLAEELSLGDTEYVGYKSKIEIAAGILQVDLSTEETGPSLVNKKRSPPLEVAFPFSDILGNHFEAAWAAAVGDKKFKDPEEKDLLTPPELGVKLGKRCRPSSLPRMKWYKVNPDSNPGWPLDSWKIDSNAHEGYMGLHNSTNTKQTDDWMEANGKLLRVLNQSTFFNKASSEVIGGMDGDMPESLKERWQILKDFMEVQSQSLEDCVAISTSLMVNLLLEKRESTMVKSKLSEQDKRAFKFFTPIDRHQRLFAGKINTFWKEKKDIGSSRVSEEMISYLKRQKRRNSPPTSKKRKFDDRGQGSFKDKEDTSYNDRANYSKNFQKKGKGNSFRGKGKGNKDAKGGDSGKNKF